MKALRSSFAPLPESLTKVNADAPRKVAEIVPFPRRLPARLPEGVDVYSRAVARLIAATFPAPSQHQSCLLAARALGVSPDTVDRILSARTARVDSALLFRCLYLYQSRTGLPFDLGGGLVLGFAVSGGDA